MFVAVIDLFFKPLIFQWPTETTNPTPKPIFLLHSLASHTMDLSSDAANGVSSSKPNLRSASTCNTPILQHLLSKGIKWEKRPCINLIAPQPAPLSRRSKRNRSPGAQMNDPRPVKRRRDGVIPSSAMYGSPPPLLR